MVPISKCQTVPDLCCMSLKHGSATNTTTYLSLNVRLTKRLVVKNSSVYEMRKYNEAADDLRYDVSRLHDMNQVVLLFVAQRPPLSVKQIERLKNPVENGVDSAVTICFHITFILPDSKANKV